MNTSKLSDWMTIATNIGIILSLVFVGLQYRQNTELLALERNADRTHALNAVLDLVIQDTSLIELMGKEPSALTQTESDRLRLLGIYLLQNMEGRFVVAENSLELDQIAVSNRAVYHRPRLNYGMPHAWEMFKAKGETDFTRWFEKEVIGHSP